MRWRQFHTGSTVSAVHGDGTLDFTFRYPPGLFTALHVRLFASAIEAAVEAAGAKEVRTTDVHLNERSADVRMVW